MGSFIGIDLGTTFSLVATIDKTGRPVIVHNSDGINMTPSVVKLTDDGIAEIGELARGGLEIDPDTIGRFKIDMGTSKNYEIAGGNYTPTDLSSFVLKKLKLDTEAAIGELSEAVITIPANFSNEGRDATLQAAKAAGLNVNYIVNEPTAAALYYAFHRGEELNGTYAVFDLGGGTFDISIIQVSGQDVEVVTSNGVSKLGGDNFDKVLQEIVQSKYKEKTGEDLEIEDYTINDAEKDKISLSKRKKVTSRVLKENISLTRDEFEENIASYIAQIEMLCESTIEEANMTIEDLNEIFLVGGSVRVPKIKQIIEKMFGNKVYSSTNIDEAVALGAALYAAYKGDRTNLTPIQKSAVEKIKVGEKTSKYFGTIALLDDPATGGKKISNSIILDKNMEIPCSVEQSYYTISDDQTGVDCTVTESSSREKNPKFVKKVWEGSLELPSGRPKGQEIKVTFSYDDNQIMHCSFIDVGSKKKKEIDLTIKSAEAIESEIDKFTVE